MTKYTYNVFDLEINDFIGINVTIEIVSQLTGLSKTNIPGYVQRNYKYKRRYKITHHEQSFIEKPKLNNTIPQETLEVMYKWDNDMMPAAQMLRDKTGKRVFKRGKPSHVERVR